MSSSNINPPIKPNQGWNLGGRPEDEDGQYWVDADRVGGKNKNTFALIGDSIMASANYATSLIPTSVVRANGIVTVTQSAHLAAPGQKIKVCNAMPDSFNGIYYIDTVPTNGVFTYKCSGPDEAAVTTGFTHPSGGGFQLLNLNQFNATSDWLWVNSLFKGGLELVHNASRGGWPAWYADSVMDQLEQEIADTGKSVYNVIIGLGINDIVGHNRTSAQIISSLKNICNYQLAMGRRVFLRTLLPLGTGYTNFATRAPVISQVNDWILNKAQQLLGVIPIDLYSPLINGVTGGAKTGLLSADNIHPTAAGAEALIAPLVYLTLSKYLTNYTPLPSSVYGTIGNNSLNKNLCDIGPWVTTPGGTLAGNVTGSICAGVFVNEVGSGEIQCAINTNSLGFVEQQLTIASVAANDRFEMETVMTAANFTAGKTLKLMLRIEGLNLDSSTGKLSGIGAWLQCTINGITCYYFIMHYSSDFSQITPGAKDWYLVSPEFTLPSGITSARIVVRAQVSAAFSGSAAVLKISQMGCDDVT